MVYQLNGVTPVRISTHDVEAGHPELSGQIHHPLLRGDEQRPRFWVMKSPEMDMGI